MAALLLGAFALAQVARAEPAHQPVTLSFLHPISTNREPGASTNFRLNILYGRSGDVRGADLGGLVARADGDFHGLELALLHSWIGTDLRGLAATGVVSVIGGEGRGVQLAGLVNFDRGRFTGVQAAGLFNSVDGDFAGAQFSSVYNLCGGDTRWLQLAGIANVCAGSLTGLQAGNINFAGRSTEGAQLGLANSAVDIRGAQAGLLNVAGGVRGAQVGVVNISQRLDGVPVGLVNVSHTDGQTSLFAVGSNLAAASFGVRTAVRGIYSMVTAGVGDLHDERSNTLFLDWHYGYAAGWGGRWRLGGDLGFVHIIPYPSDDPDANDRLHFAVQPRLLAEGRMGPNLRLLAGVGATVIWNEYSAQATPETEPLVLLGVSFE